MTVTITINADTAVQAREQMYRLLGASVIPVEQDATGAMIAEESADAEDADSLAEWAESTRVTEPAAVEQPKAEKPAPKKRGRKPKEQKTHPDMIVDHSKDGIKIVSQTGVEAVEQTLIDEQDAADEAAESAATKPAHLTHDDVRHELGIYVRNYGVETAQIDGPALFKLVFPELTIQKISDIPDDQESLAKAIAGVKEMVAKNPYERTATTADVTA